MRLVARKWQKAMKGRGFHYKEMGNETELLEKLATIGIERLSLVRQIGQKDSHLATK